MLTAISHRKTTLARDRYFANAALYKRSVALEFAQPDSYRRTQEDEVVSLVFGVLQYLPVVERTSLLIEWLLPHHRKEFIDSELRFWPLRRAKVDDGEDPLFVNVEPDIEIDLIRPNAPAGEKEIVILEAKWNSPLSGVDQLRKQWHAVKRSAGQQPFKHLLLVRTKVRAESDWMTNHPSQSSVIVMTWQDVAARIRWTIRQPVLSRQPHIAKLCEELLRFLDSVNIHTFDGFDDVGSDATTVPQEFWCPRFDFNQSRDFGVGIDRFWMEKDVT